jgi:hypothetical protein
MISTGTVLRFISHFQTSETIKVFTEGCCYWFAKILVDRFESLGNAKIIYNPVLGHFAAELDGTKYDITGILSTDDNNKSWHQWYAYATYDGFDKLDNERVRKYCIELQDE